MSEADRGVVQAYVALGSNLDNPVSQVRSAIRAVGDLPGCCLLAASRLYRTPPWGHLDQPDFINAVVRIQTSLGPLSLLDALLGLERAAGRQRAVRWGPRTLDLDLLLHGEARMHDTRLELPHPRMHERAFVMLPLAEIAPDLLLPGLGRADRIAANLPAAGIERLAD